MQNSIVSLGIELPNAHARIGRKAAVLNQLALAGFPVPPGICVTSEAFQTAIAPFAEPLRTLCAGRNLRELAVAQHTAQEMARLLEEMRLPVGLSQELARRLPTLGSGALAVRSSATLEDLAGASFAGQYQTVLGVTDEQAVAQAILTCWRSFFSLNALFSQAHYAERQAVATPLVHHGMAVLIQPLLNPDCAGVCFTVDPVQRRADLLLVTAAWGLGVGVVEGSVPVDTIQVRRRDLSSAQASIADKDSCLRLGADRVVQRVAVPAAQRGMACLPESWLKRVAHFALAAEQHLGEPQDVEWAIADQQVWLLQSRPITTLPAEVRQATHFPVEWANEEERTRSWWLEWSSDRPSALLLPAEVEFVKSSSRGGQAAVILGGSAKTRWRKVVNGRIYMAVADSTLTRGDQRIRRAALHDLFARLQAQDVTMWEHWGPEIMRATERLGAFSGQGADGHALAAHLEDVLAASERHWMVHTLMPRFGRIEPLLELYAKLSGKQPEEAEDDLPFLLQGAETVQTRLVEALYDLAVLALERSVVAEWLEQKGPGRYARLGELADAQPFMARFAQLLALYGDRFALLRQGLDGESVVELPLPWRAAPEYVLEMVALYLPLARGSQAAAPRAARARSYGEQQAKVAAICAAATPALAAAFRQQLAYFQRNAAFLDEHNHYIDQLSFGQYAQALLYAGRWLAGRGDLTHPYDAFWLHPPEILAALRAQAKQEFGQVIAERQKQFAIWRIMQTPGYIGLPDAHAPKRPKSEASPHAPEADAPVLAPHTLRGQSASAGQGAGRARILGEAVGLPAMAPGDVLVAVHAGPLWTPVLPTLAAIVLDAGGVGEHCAITAREFGVPAVFGAVNATLRIPPGAWVTVDGDVGTVTWE